MSYSFQSPRDKNRSKLFIIDLDYTLLDTKRVTDHIKTCRVPTFLGSKNAKLFPKAYAKARSADKNGKVNWNRKPHTDVRVASKELAKLLGIPKMEFMIYYSLFASIDFSEFLTSGAVTFLKALKYHNCDIVINTEGENAYQEQKLRSCGVSNYVDILNLNVIPDKMDPSHIAIDLKLSGISYLAKNYSEIYVIDDKPAVLKKYHKVYPQWKYILSDYGPYAENYEGKRKSFVYISGKTPDEIHRQLFPNDFRPIDILSD